MPKLPRMTPRKLIAALVRHGFIIDRQRGSHVIIRHEQDQRMASIPLHTKDVPLGTLRGILSDLELNVGELFEML